MTSYLLRISTDKGNYQTLNQIFSYTREQNVKSFWEFEIDENSIQFHTAIEVILGKLKEVFPSLQKLDITTDDISIWYLYEYSGQCNMEFSPLQLKSLADLQLTFCISCWEK
jgi:hypothetical protein